MDTKPPRVGVYARISEDKDGTQTATARQRQDCRAFADRKGWDIMDEFEDVDISAFSRTAKRPEFERMLVALREGEIDGVLVWKLDRLTRQQRDLVRVMEACDAHKAFVASVTEPIDTRESYGQFVAELLVAQARMESANTSARQTRKAQQEREQGLPPTNGRRCFGYGQRYDHIIPEEAAVIREARDRLLAGDSLRSVCVDLERRGVVSTAGNPWRPQLFKRLLTTPTIAGLRTKDGQLFPGTWQPIISAEDHTRLVAQLNRHASGPRRASARKYLLTGFLRCGRCNGRMSAHPRTGKTRAYVCRSNPGYGGCGKMSAKAEPLEELVKEMVLAAVDDAALAEALRARGEADDGLIESVRRDERALEALSQDFYVDAVISRSEFLAARDGLAARLEGNRARLARRDSRNVVGSFVGGGDALRDAWEAGSLDWRRSVVGALLDYVVIKPGKPGRLAFDPERVEPVWRY